jgi:DNA polymerase-1
LDFIENSKKDFSKEANQISRLIQFLGMFDELQGLIKLESTYSEFPTWADGRVHGQYLIHGTSTGRLASRKPNMQNFPKKSKLGKEVRKLFVAPRGRVFISADYSNLEARIVGYEANEPNVQEIFAKGLNQHDINTKKLFHLTPDDPKWELARRAAKTFQFGLIQYGGSDREIHRKISIEVPELGLTLAELKIAKENYFQANPNLLQWRLKVENEVNQTRKITNAFGRIRLFHSNSKDIIKEAYNFPMQSAAASIINRATIKLFKILQEQFPETLLVAQIHDQLVFEAPDRAEYLKKLLPLIRTEMERPVKAWNTVVSFPVDFELGPSLGELEKFEL